MAWWLVDGVGMQVNISSAADLTQRLIDVSASRPDAPTLTLQKESDRLMHIGVSKDIGYLNYVEGPNELSYVSIGDPDAKGTLWFSYAGSGSEIPLRHCLPMSLLLKGILEFYHTCAMPSSVRWEPD